MVQDSIQGGTLIPQAGENLRFPLPHGIAEKDTVAIQQDTINKTSETRDLPGTEWAAILFVLGFALFAWVHYFHGRRLKQIYQAFMGVHYSNQMLREGNPFHERFSIPLQLLALSSISYFIYRSLLYFGRLPDFFTPGLSGYLLVLAVITGLWVIKLVAVRINGLLFKTNPSALAYNINMLVYLIMSGLMILPLIVLQTYMDIQVFTIAGMILLGIMFLLWIIRGISIGLAESGFSVLHLFLYLCSFEFLPVLVLIKLILITS